MFAARILGIGDGFVPSQFQTVLKKYTPKNILKLTPGLTTTLTNATQLISIITAGIMDVVDTKIIFLAFGIIVLAILSVFFPRQKTGKRIKIIFYLSMKALACGLPALRPLS